MHRIHSFYQSEGLIVPRTLTVIDEADLTENKSLQQVLNNIPAFYVLAANTAAACTVVLKDVIIEPIEAADA